MGVRGVQRLDTRTGLACMFVVALGIRLAIAPSVGLFYDLYLFGQWAAKLHNAGLRHFYVGNLSRDYPPGYLYVLAVIGRISRTPSYTLLKLPAMLGDLGLAGISGLLAARLAPAASIRGVPVRAAVVAAVLFNPALIALSAVWGQVDVVPVFFVMASLLVLLTGKRNVRRDAAAMLLLAVAFAIKPQSSFLFPAIGYLLYRRYVGRRRGAELGQGLARLGIVCSGGLVAWAVCGIPFGLSPHALWNFYKQASGAYKSTSIWAFNGWGAIGFLRGDVRGAVPPVRVIAGVPAFHLGLIAFALGTAYVLWRMHRAIERGLDEAVVVLAGAAMTSLLAFTVLTRMHERYMFPAIALLAPIVVWRGFRRAYVALSALFVVNLWYAFALDNLSFPREVSLHVEPVFTWLFGPVRTTDTWQKTTWSLLVVAACVTLVARGFAWIERPETGTNRLLSPTRSGDGGGSGI